MEKTFQGQPKCLESIKSKWELGWKTKKLFNNKYILVKPLGEVAPQNIRLWEDTLYAEYKEARAKGKFFKRWWLNARAKQLLKDHYPGKELKYSDQWLMRFCRRYQVALRRKTHSAQTHPKQLAPAITKFHSKLLRVRRCGVYQTKDIANMDQTSLPFVLGDWKT